MAEPTIEPVTWTYMLEPAHTLPFIAAITVMVWSFFTASCIGSFLNVVIARMPQGRSVMRPRSQCTMPGCGYWIAWYDNIPIFSWLWLRAKCRQCKSPISARYVLIELLVGGLGMGIAWRYGLGAQGLELFAFACILVCIAWIDIDTFYFPWPLLIACAVLGLAAGILGVVFDIAPAPVLVGPLGGTPIEGLVSRLIGAFGGLVFLGAILVVSTGILRRIGRIEENQYAMGHGDPLLLAGICSVVGWRGIAGVIFLASAQGVFVDRLQWGIRKIRSLIGERSDSSTPAVSTEYQEMSKHSDSAVGQEGADNENDKESESAFDEDADLPEGAIPFGPLLALAGLEMAMFSEQIFAAIGRLAKW